MRSNFANALTKWIFFSNKVDFLKLSGLNGVYLLKSNEMKKLLYIFAMAIVLAGTSSCSNDMDEPLLTVDSVDLDQYIGTWYEIGSIPQFFNVGCQCTKAEYDFAPDGNIRVRNSCTLGSPTGAENRVVGRARVQRNTEGNSKLEVRFGSSPWAPYWIIELADDYSYAVVSDPARGTFFVLSRERQMDPALYAQLLANGRAQGVDVNRVTITNQVNCTN
jgi:apolipoprotein D and lipocalin family protein